MRVVRRVDEVDGGNPDAEQRPPIVGGRAGARRREQRRRDRAARERARRVGRRVPRVRAGRGLLPCPTRLTRVQPPLHFRLLLLWQLSVQRERAVPQ